MSPVGNSKQRGFTLVELMVTLALAALMLSLVPPLLGKGGDRARLDHDAKLLAEKLRLARSRAIVSDSEVTMRLDQALSRGVTASIDSPADLPGAIRFYPDGGASGAVIHLANDSGSRTLSVDWLTGTVEKQP